LSPLWSGYALPTPRQNHEKPRSRNPGVRSTQIPRGAVRSSGATSIIEPLLLNKQRGAPRVDDGQTINGILRRFRTGSP
jgi:hypothetical protein